MPRLIILFAVVFGVFWWLRARAEAQRRKAPPPRPESAAHKARPGTAPEAMVQCAQCGVHLPQSDAIAWRGLHYCRRSHLPDDRVPDDRMPDDRAA